MAKLVLSVCRTVAEFPDQSSPVTQLASAFQTNGESAFVHGYRVLFEPFIVETIIAAPKVRCHGHVAHGTSRL